MDVSSRVIVCLVEGLIPFSFGLYFTLLHRRIIGRKPGEDPAHDARMHTLRWFRWAGPLLMLLGLFQALQGIFFYRE